MIAAGYWLIVADIGLAAIAALCAVAVIFSFVLWLDSKGREVAVFFALMWFFIALAVLAAAGATAIHAA